ncbi:hypothetical protein AB0P17_42995 [Streptomyces sp. NPDC088124]|uniref:hypothetical protein n=1 Tax=Streptomyces sp. NPDC088124 TaxID=3154654 RepID=UPI003412907F
MTPWLNGETTWQLFQDARDKKGSYEGPLKAAVDVCTAVGQLHQAGWVHSDLQPHHTIHMPDRMRLINCSWAWHMSLPPSLGYGGGIVHFLASSPS